MFFQNRADKLFEQGVAQLQHGQHSLAIDTFSKVIQIEGNDALASRLNRGIAHLFLVLSDQNSGDEQSFEEHLELSVKDFSLAINKIKSQIRKSNEAINMLAELYYRRSESLMWLQKYQEAISDLNEAIRQNGGNSDYYFQRGFVFTEMIGDAQTGIQDYTKGLNIGTRAYGYTYRAWANFDLGNKEKAKADYYSAVKLDPNEKNRERSFSREKYVEWEYFKKNL